MAIRYPSPNTILEEALVELETRGIIPVLSIFAWRDARVTHRFVAMTEHEANGIAESVATKARDYDYLSWFFLGQEDGSESLDLVLTGMSALGTDMVLLAAPVHDGEIDARNPIVAEPDLEDGRDLLRSIAAYKRAHRNKEMMEAGRWN